MSKSFRRYFVSNIFNQVLIHLLWFIMMIVCSSGNKEKNNSKLLFLLRWERAKAIVEWYIWALSTKSMTMTARNKDTYNRILSIFPKECNFHPGSSQIVDFLYYFTLIWRRDRILREGSGFVVYFYCQLWAAIDVGKSSRSIASQRRSGTSTIYHVV
jgi:hypothetical protein